MEYRTKIDGCPEKDMATKTMINGSSIMVGRDVYGGNSVRIEQDDDLVVLADRDVEEFINAITNHHPRPIEQEPDLVVFADGDGKVFFEAIRNHPPPPMVLEPAPGKWYVVLENSNQRLTNGDNKPTTFTSYSSAYMYARGFGGEEWIHCPISVDEYERVFGR